VKNTIDQPETVKNCSGRFIELRVLGVSMTIPSLQNAAIDIAKGNVSHFTTEPQEKTSCETSAPANILISLWHIACSLTRLILEEQVHVMAVNISDKFGDDEARKYKRAGETCHADRCKEFDVIEYGEQQQWRRGEEHPRVTG
jgi:hypothetical protein